MTTTHGHLTIVERRPPTPQVEIVGRIYNIVQEPEPESQLSRVGIEPEDVETGEVEAKVVKARRGRRPTVNATEVAETA